MTETILEETTQVETVVEESKSDKDTSDELKCNEDRDEEEEFNYTEHAKIFTIEVMEHLISVIKRKESLDYDKRYAKAKELLNYEDAPPFLKHNPFILSGYRGILNTAYCIQSVFWWTNESLNIWSHLFGLTLFTGLIINDLLFLRVEASVVDKFIVASVLLCFQACMFLSAVYHTFNCRSARDCDLFLSFDLLGVALSLLAIYISGIYYAFWCNTDLQSFYISTVTVIFALAMVLQLPQLSIDAYVKMMVFVGWAAYGVVPTFHWAIVMGGFENPVVALLLPRVLGMYCITGIAFFFYITKIPERLFEGCFDFIGHSHQWWHMFVVLALYYWHNTGIMYIEYRMNHACANHMRLP